VRRWPGEEGAASALERRGIAGSGFRWSGAVLPAEESLTMAFDVFSDDGTRFFLIFFFTIYRFLWSISLFCLPTIHGQHSIKFIIMPEIFDIPITIAALKVSYNRKGNIRCKTHDSMCLIIFKSRSVNKN
jgi:hypothetical protein